MKLLWSLTFIICAFPVIAKQNTQIHQSLDIVTRDIQALESKLQQQRQQSSMATAELAKTEIHLGKLSDQIRQAKVNIVKKQAYIKALEQTRQYLQDNQNKSEKALAEQMKSKFGQHHKEQFSLLLNPDDVTELSKVSVYYDYFQTARKYHIEKLHLSLVKAKQTHITLSKEQKNLATQLVALNKQQAQLEQFQSTRKKLLAHINQEMLKDKHSLKGKQAKHHEYQRLLTELEAQIKHNRVKSTFSMHKGNIAFPVSQSSILSIVQNKNQYMIEADVGTKVKAVFGGKVVFANWLRGFGLLLIVDHGNGYMSLYGHNQTLYKTLGDSVIQDEVISRVGQSGGITQSGLYFEIRKDGHALNPKKWLKHA